MPCPPCDDKVKAAVAVGAVAAGSDGVLPIGDIVGTAIVTKAVLDATGVGASGEVADDAGVDGTTVKRKGRDKPKPSLGTRIREWITGALIAVGLTEGEQLPKIEPEKDPERDKPVPTEYHDPGGSE